MRRHATNTAAFRRFHRAVGFRQPSCRSTSVSAARVVREGKGGLTTARVKNVGDGTARVTIAAARGERFAEKAKTPLLGHPHGRHARARRGEGDRDPGRRPPRAPGGRSRRRAAHARALEGDGEAG